MIQGALSALRSPHHRPSDSLRLPTRIKTVYPARFHQRFLRKLWLVAGNPQTLIFLRGGFHPYLPLAAGDSSVKSIERVNFTVAGGGLIALIIVKPLKTFFCASECRRESSGATNSIGAASWNDSITMQAGAPEIKQGARLGIIAKGHAGNLASSTLVGTLTTFWS